LLGVSEESVDDIRHRDAANAAHLAAIPTAVRERWVGGAERGLLPGTADAQTIFRMGEDTRSCMAVRRNCAHQNKALVGYLLAGNVRLVVMRNDAGRVEARAVARLLLRRDTMAPVLFCEEVYFASGASDALKRRVEEEAAELARAVGVPLYSIG
ncbi:unnamed protein product, partial [Phaeothamnion confervicola]